MQNDDQKRVNQKDSFRYKFLEVHAQIMNSFQGPPLFVQAFLEIFVYIQILKYPIDYFSTEWFGSNQAIISYIDVSYPFRVLLPKSFSIVYFVVLGIIGTYVILFLSLFRPYNQNYSRITGAILKVVFIFFSTFGFIMPVGLVINTLGCSFTSKIWKCDQASTMDQTGMIIGFIVSGVFLVVLLIQSMLKFEFIQIEGQNKLLRDSSYQSTAMLLFIIINQVLSIVAPGIPLIIVNVVCLVLLFILLILKQQNLVPTFEKIQITLILLNLFFGICTLVNLIAPNVLEFYFCLIAAFFVLIGGLQIDTFSIAFELQNINKWNTPVLMMRYAKGLRKLTKKTLKNSFQHVIMAHGYIDQHRKKCEMEECPIRLPRQAIQSHKLGKLYDKSTLQIKRLCALIKRIYEQGDRLSPPIQDLQLQFASFLYETGQRDMSLKILLLQKYEQLSLEKYYKYFTLKRKIYSQICDESQKKFLDLLSELQVKRIEQQLLEEFEEVALTNLQFWSILNEDHPDFQKLNDVGVKLVRIGNLIRSNYAQMSNYAYNERITNLFIQYLISIENDEDLFNEISNRLKDRFDLNRKIVLQDWANSTFATILISAQQTNFGIIIDLNSTFASIMGYEKYQLMNRDCKVLFGESTISQLSRFLLVDEDQYNDEFFLLHKNGYLIKINRVIQNFNSMQTGFTFIITAEHKVSPASAFLIIQNQSSKILGVSAGNILMFNFQQKMAQKYASIDDIFSLKRQDLFKSQQRGAMIVNGVKLFKKGYMDQATMRNTYNDQECEFSIIYNEVSKQLGCVKISLVRPKVVNNRKEIQTLVNFRFQIQATLSDFKYVSQTEDGSSLLRQFSMLSFKSDVNQAVSLKNYAGNIETLRLINNIIMVIEQDGENSSEIEKQLEKNGENTLVEKLERKDEQIIFANKDSYNDFMRSRTIKTNIARFFVAGLICSLLIYVVFFAVFTTQTSSSNDLFLELGNQNLLIGSIAKFQSYIQHYVQHNVSMSRIPLQFIPPKIYRVIQKMQLLRLNGSVPFPIPIYLNQHSISQVKSDQFILSYANYGLEFTPRIQVAKTSAQVKQILKTIDYFTIFNLIKNGQQARKFMQQKKNQRKAQIEATFSSIKMMNIIMLLGGVVFQLAFGIAACLFIYQILTHKVSLMRAFLQVNEIQIIKFTNRTESFISILHMEQNAGENQGTNEDSEIKKASAMFSKKKSFKQIKIEKWIYLKILILPLIAQIFFVQTFLAGYSNISLILQSVNYLDLASSADSFFYSRLVEYQNQFLGGPSQVNTTAQMTNFYAQIFNQHYKTLGKYPQYHEKFMNIFLGNICNGTYQVSFACLSQIYPSTSRGAIILFSKLVIEIEERFKDIDFQSSFYVSFEVLTEAHEKLNEQLIKQQQILVNQTGKQLVNTLLIWVFVVSGVALLYTGPAIKNFLNQINDNKDMMTILPYSLAKQSVQVNIQIKKFLSQDPLSVNTKQNKKVNK